MQISHFMKMIIILFHVFFLAPASASKRQQIVKKNSSETQKCLEFGKQGFVAGVPGKKGWVLKQPCCKPFIDREPKGIEPYGGGYQYICLACGDRFCDSKYEDKKNCAEDCL